MCLCVYVGSTLVAQMLTDLSKVTEMPLDLNPVVTIIADNISPNSVLCQTQCSLHMCSFFSSSQQPYPHPILQMEKQSTQRLDNLPKVTKLLSGGTRT